MIILTHILRNPHLLAGTVFARATASAASILWGLIVLLQESALANWEKVYGPLIAIVHENVVAAILVSIGVTNLVRLWRYSKPYWPWSIGYALLALWWCYAIFLVLIASPPFPPTAITGVTLCAFLSLVAFMSNPVKHGDRAAIE